MTELLLAEKIKQKDEHIQVLLQDANELREKCKRISTALYVICKSILKEDLSELSNIMYLKILAKMGLDILKEFGEIKEEEVKDESKNL